MWLRSVVLPVAFVLSAATCGDTPTTPSTARASPLPTTVGPVPTVTRAQLLGESLTVFLQGVLRGTRDGPWDAAQRPSATGVSLDPADSLLYAAALELIVHAAETLPPDSAGGR
jgi:hypothetical protein